jgi:hypothetical protein
LGLFIGRDPIGYLADINRYSYCGNCAVTGSDPFGLYDIAGHFWTTYLVALASGNSPQSAYELAYYSQLPDQKQFTDAYEQGVRTFFGVSDVDWAKEVQVWLHSLHGGGPAAVAARRACLRKLLQGGCASLVGKLYPWEKGIIIHAIGDATAHTYEEDGQRYAYSAPWGHAFAGHWPDVISSDPWGYGQYIQGLYKDIQALPTYTNAAGAPTDPKGIYGQLIVKADFFSRNVHFWATDELAAEETALRGIAQTNGYSTSGYDPSGGGLDEKKRTPSPLNIAKLINKMRKCCNCPTIALPLTSPAGLGIRLSEWAQQLGEEASGLPPLPQE